MKQNDVLEKVKEKAKISDYKKVTKEQYAQIQEMVAQQEISKEELKILVDAIPNFVQLQKDYVDGLKELIGAAKETQKDALKGISSSLDGILKLLNTILEKAETEELRSKIADIALSLANYNLEIAKILHEANKENNTTWKIIGGGLAGVILLVAGIFKFKK